MNADRQTGPRLDDGRPLFHLHIPKTGGTTLYQALLAALGRDGVWLVTTGEISSEAIAQRASGIRLLAGHLTWAVVGAFPRPPRVLTVLRDPVERALSVYSYLRENAKSGILSGMAAAQAQEAASRTLSESVLDRHTSFRPVLGPVQAGYLSGDGPDLRFDGSTLMPNGDLDLPAIERALELAMDNLEACWWVGTTETLDRDIATLLQRLGYQPLARIPRHNATQDRTDRSILSQAARQELERLVAADQALYERARTLAAEQSRP